MKKFFGWIFFLGLIGFLIHTVKSHPQLKEHFSLCKMRFLELFKPEEEIN